MYASTTATREKGLVAAAATERAMSRHVCCRSQFKFKCFSCGEMINRGDKITKCTTAASDGMDLRFRGADCRNGLTMEETAFYMSEYGTRSWVHIGCNPCFWDRDEGRLFCVWTDWGAKIAHEFEEWRSFTNHYNMEEFLEKHGYPQDKWMKDRIICAVTRFQARWRGYLYKRDYLIALRAKKATEAINVNSQTSLVSKQEKQIQVGENYEILMDRGKSNEAVYSAEVISVDSGIYVPRWVSVKFHYDGEVRDYRQRRFWRLVEECYKFKEQVGIEATIIGKISTRYRYKGKDDM